MFARQRSDRRLIPRQIHRGPFGTEIEKVPPVSLAILRSGAVAAACPKAMQ